MNTKNIELNFRLLVKSIGQIHNELKQQAFHSVNTLLTLRNWLIGYYIAEYELKGSDRADYGDMLFERLEEELKRIGVSRSNKRDLYRLRLFYNTYPQIVGSLTPQLQKLISHKLGSLSSDNSILTKPFLQIVESVTPQSGIAPRELITKLSFTHIEVLINIEDETKRKFYEIECIRGNWSVRELKRQVNSLYYERSTLSTDKKKLSEQTQQKVELFNPAQSIRDPYIFEFLGLKPLEVMSESDLEDQLLDKLQGFLLELGHGFCFEARQKAILIEDTNFYIDLVFYHRILKCHVLVELKLSDFNHENIGQLNTYVSWYSKNIKEPKDNEPIGILLCTGKNNTLVEYALAGMDNHLFVSKYMLELPSKTEMQSFIASQMYEEIE
ncbi:MAG: PDDEXK nuclease domain-containing protein [Candidatus Cloacimonetes bacterium]|jgi:predicted nuclease of restriction endonuclease-like (RecB) superfamily|nr:PDDEXK nuclease domain-containing protein [Candidatus Cloacimonadota bacterium]MDD2423315.1 PDDEXK nuclease domain-containing protein [Candidatus Cloacimonadota bacterium]MDD4277793.1 PDDEXK nuclease domain-containing protein [Candidatus Cloacimonadota bacterium]MDY0325043.1 PDDEXK nuclease domain-containing protein [Candidatus Cloacimonadaceae bacterium]